jgi:hypothetical protein
VNFPDLVKESPDEGNCRSNPSTDLKIYRYLVALPGLVFIIYIAISAQLKFLCGGLFFFTMILTLPNLSITRSDHVHSAWPQMYQIGNCALVSGYRRPSLC